MLLIRALVFATVATAVGFLLAAAFLGIAVGLRLAAIAFFHTILGDFVETLFASVAYLGFNAVALKFGALHCLSLLALHGGAVAVDVHLLGGIGFLVEVGALFQIYYTARRYHLLGFAFTRAVVTLFLVLSHGGE